MLSKGSPYILYFLINSFSLKQLDPMSNNADDDLSFPGSLHAKISIYAQISVYIEREMCIFSLPRLVKLGLIRKYVTNLCIF